MDSDLEESSNHAEEVVECVEETESFYTIRLDDIDDSKIDSFFKKYKDEYKRVWIFDEIADVTGKQHMQGVISFNRELSKKEEVKHRNRISSFFDRKGSKFSFQKVKDIEAYLVYIVKGGKVVIQIGYTDQDYSFYKGKQEQVVKKIQADKVKRQSSTKKPMELLFEFYEPIYLEEYEKAKKLQVDFDFNHDKFLSRTFDLPRHIVRHVIIYWGEMAHKSFMMNKIAEASDYVAFRIYRKYTKKLFEEVMSVNEQNILERMTFCKRC